MKVNLMNLPIEFKGEDACPGLKKGIATFISFLSSISLVCQFSNILFYLNTKMHTTSVSNYYSLSFPDTSILLRIWIYV
jgi:hypothetical protein